MGAFDPPITYEKGTYIGALRRTCLQPGLTTRNRHWQYVLPLVPSPISSDTMQTRYRARPPLLARPISFWAGSPSSRMVCPHLLFLRGKDGTDLRRNPPRRPAPVDCRPTCRDLHGKILQHWRGVHHTPSREDVQGVSMGGD